MLERDEAGPSRLALSMRTQPFGAHTQTPWGVRIRPTRCVPSLAAHISSGAIDESAVLLPDGPDADPRGEIPAALRLSRTVKVVKIKWPAYRYLRSFLPACSHL